jgi:AraC-like DNA-binding protein
MSPSVSALADEQMIETFDYGLESFAVCEIGQGWRLTSPPFEGVFVHFVLQGEGVLEFRGAHTKLRKNEIVVAPKGTSKYIEGTGPILWEVAADDGCALLTDGLVAFRAHVGGPDLVLVSGVLSSPDGRAVPLDHLLDPVVCSIAGLDTLEANFRALLEELSAPGPGAAIIAECLMKQCFVLLVRDHIGRFGEQSPLFVRASDPRLKKAVAAMFAKPGDSHTVASLAQEAGMSRSPFATLFLEYYRETPVSFLQGVRLRTAARMLRLGMLPVKAIAATVGYASRSHFSKAFKVVYGLDPSKYRRRGLKQASELLRS